jgi:undecaprenyl-diphosphatase
MRKEMNRGIRAALLGIPPLIIALIGPSRVYLGDHWATDVLGGYLFGGGWFGFSLSLYLMLRDQ